MFPSPNSSNSIPPFLTFLSDFHSSTSSSSPNNNFPLDFSSNMFLQPSSLMMNMDQPHITTSMEDDVTKSKKQVAAAAPRKRTSKKDRHSKIYTAKGPRDRRMRLSLDVARKFFDLQDMLGFDKASSTVEWLLNQSESSIDQLVKKTLIGNAAITTTVDYCKLATRPPISSSCSPSIITSKCDMTAGCEFDDGSRKIMINSSGGSSSCGARIDVIRESRKMARARAKERTMEKMRIQSLKSGSNNHQQTSLLMELDDTRQLLGLHQEHDNVVVAAAAAHTQQHLYTADLQLLTKPWEEEEEAYNGPSYLY